MKENQDTMVPFIGNYCLEVCQQPIHARCCGFGNKDRRHIGPVPILQLYHRENDGKRIKIRNRSSLSNLLVHCDIYAEDQDEPRNLVHLSSVPGGGGARHKSVSLNSAILNLPSSHVTKSLVGSTVSNAYELMDPHGERGIFFIFDDLSVRIEGQYRLRFQLMDLSSKNQISNVMDLVYSNPFKVYAPKHFPGVLESTELSRCFASQGLKIAVRSIKEKEKGKREEIRLRGEENSSGDDDVVGEIGKNVDDGRSQSTPPYTRIHISSVLHPPSSP
ncbi:velvet factor-domain-containing protein [Absidia repens]|uniref:Velvet factor-domain-containing protein n=1 Tax=Absidia repens TaxID=90262 RepID=A0A1X2I6X8_9FUNG|nr:velvet factor-domain-containing protein [Absidia repens]